MWRNIYEKKLYTTTAEKNRWSVAFLENLDNPNPDPLYGSTPQTNYPIGTTHSIGGIREPEMTSQRSRNDQPLSPLRMFLTKRR